MSILSNREQSNRISRALYYGSVVIAGIFLAFSFVMLFSQKLRIPWSFDGNLIQGTVSAWNDAAYSLGSKDFILLPSYNLPSGASQGGEGFFLLMLTIVLSLAGSVLILGGFSWSLLLFLIPEVIISAFTSQDVGIIFYILSALGILNALIVMKTKDSWQSLITTAIIALIMGLFFGVIPKDIRDRLDTDLNIGIKDKISNMYFGVDPLGHGDLSQRERITGDDIALRVTMSRPREMYLRGFLGSRFDGRSWRDLDNSVYYNDNDLIASLVNNGFNPLGQLGESGAMADVKGDASNTVEIQNLNGDSRIAFVPYEIESVGTLSDSAIKGGGELSTGKIGRFKKYSYTVGDNLCDKWTDVAGSFFERAIGTTDENLLGYLSMESYYNSFIYDNYTYLGLKERELLAANIGSPGDLSKGHLDYKIAIKSIRKYLEDGFIYSEDLGGRASSSKNEIEEFLESRKGFDVHFASLATLMFRYYGIPARYVEGYIIPEALAKEAIDGKTMEVKQSEAHAWTEIYVDGIGFVPLEVTPEFYGVMKEADMNIGISNEGIMNAYQNLYGNHSSAEEEEPLESSPGGNEAWNYMWYGLIALIGILLLALIIALIKRIGRLLHSYLEKRRLMYKEEPKRSVAAIYSFMEKENLMIDEEAMELGNRAAYSMDTITEKDREFMIKKYEELKAAAKSKAKTALRNNKTPRVITSVLILAFISLSLSSCQNSKSGNENPTKDNLPEVLDEVTSYLVEEIPDPTISAVGGDWMIFALSKSGCEISDKYFGRYYDNARAEIKKKSGILSEDKYTEYERVIIGLDSINKDAKDIEGYDLTQYLNDYDTITNQGVNAAWYAILAINVADLQIENEKLYVDYVRNSIETKEYDGAGLSDYLSIGMQALSYYGDDAAIDEIISRGVDTLSGYMLSDGSLGNCESTAMCIIALAMNGINPLEDERFIKDGKTLWDGLMEYYLKDGSFCHTKDIPESNLMATEQSLLALDAIRLFEKGEKLYS